MVRYTYRWKTTNTRTGNEAQSQSLEGLCSWMCRLDPRSMRHELINGLCMYDDGFRIRVELCPSISQIRCMGSCSVFSFLFQPSKFEDQIKAMVQRGDA